MSDLELFIDMMSRAGFSYHYLSSPRNVALRRVALAVRQQGADVGTGLEAAFLFDSEGSLIGVGWGVNVV